MEVVSVTAGVGVGGVGEVLSAPQPPPPQTSFQPQHHSIRACLQHQEQERCDDEDEDDDDSRMDTDPEGGASEEASRISRNDLERNPALLQEVDSNCDSPPRYDEEGADHMDYEESHSRQTFLEDEDSSCRAFPDGGGSDPQASSSPIPTPMPETGRRNKRKNFQPRNIVYFADSDENEEGDRERDDEPGGGKLGPETPLDLSDVPIRRSLLPRRLDGASEARVEDHPLPNPHINALLKRGSPISWGVDPPPPDLPEYAEQAMRRLLGLYGINDLQENLSSGFNNASFISGKILESLKSNGTSNSPLGESGSSSGSGNGSGEPPTPPHTPQRDGTLCSSSSQEANSRSSHIFDAGQQAIQAKLFGERNFSTLLTLAALQEGKACNPGGEVPLPPTLDASKSLPTTPTTPTSTAVTPGLANLSLGNGGTTPPTMVSGGIGVRDHLSKQPVDYTRYVKRYSSAMECGSASCRELNHREHFHCLDCSSKIFSKKEEMIRHFKWHKKRDESLQHGFMRYSPTDDCSDRFSNCSHNRKQTHYHCLKDGCDKVYISTSDVQMHANYHRKDSAIMQEGFQRFRASEDCNQASCPFSGQRTTHFHCMRYSCNFTFKNKADMEKHKTYHIKDEQLTKDGFKKFMKQEDCCYDGCKLSKVSNHIHCIRPDCNYVLHSSGQIFAHKRKHERQDHEKAYRQYKLAQTVLGVPEAHPAFTPLLHDALRPLGGLGGPMMGSFGGELGSDKSPSPLGHAGQSSPSIPHPPPVVGRAGPSPFLAAGFPPGIGSEGQHPLARLLGVPPAAHAMFPGGPAPNITPTPTSSSSSPASPVDLSVSVGNSEEAPWERNIRFYSREDSCRSDCELSSLEHWHCEECEALFHTRETAKDHAKVHEQESEITEENYTRIVPGESSQRCPPDCQIQDQAEHFHCNWEGCSEAILAAGDKTFRRLDHFRMHDFARRLPVGSSQPGNGIGVASVTSIDAMFKRKRGRPPKNRIIELPVSSSHDSPQAIFTSFKLPKSSPPPAPPLPVGLPSNPLLSLGPPGLSPLGQLAHMGREIPGAIVASNALPPPLPPGIPPLASRIPIMLPINEPVVCNPRQPQVESVDGFYLWEEGTICCDQLCLHLGRRHYHCSHSRCLFVSASSDALATHSREFHDTAPIPEGFIAIDRGINCRLSSCQNNKMNKHFHCTKCGYSFTRYQNMEAHAEKHLQEGDGLDHSLGPVSPIYLQKPRPDSPMETPAGPTSSPSVGGSSDTPTKSQYLIPVVKSSGIFYPLSPFPNASHGGMTRSSASTTNSEPGALVTPIAPSSKSSTLPTYTIPVTGCLSITATLRSPGPPPHYSPVPSQERMDQEDSDDSSDNNKPIHDSINDSEYTNAEDRSMEMTSSSDRPISSVMEQDSSIADNHVQYSLEISCGRPFCKLKKKDHFHCQICNQAFSEQERLRPHLMRHLSGFGSPLASSDHGVDEKETRGNDSSQDNGEDSKSHLSEAHADQPPYSPNGNSAISSISGHLPVMTSSTSPIVSLGSLAGPQPPPQFPSPLIYSQAAGFHGLPTPFGPHFGITGMFPGTLPRLLPPGAWPGVHPALAAMTHPHLMLSQVRPNGEIPSGSQSGQCGVGSMSPVIGSSGVTSPPEPSPILPSSLSTSPHLALLRKRLGPDDYCMQETKKIRSSASIRLLKDEPVPEGYIRFRFNEDCQYPHCGYREHQTHFHCMRHDCGYSFCDKTRFVQHTARHERLDTLMGGDFQQFRSNVSCGRSECVYASMIGQQQNKASHFHCLKCEFVCTDTNKVVAHRRQHQKRDSINAAGFEKFTPSQPCGVQSCTHNQKQTHYHCLKCHYSVLGLSQMSAHKLRHLE